MQRAIAALFWIGDYEHAQPLLEAVVERARSYGFRTMLPTLLDTLAAINLRTGHLSLADARSAEALRLARQVGQTPVMGSCLTTLAGIAAARGDAAATRSYADEALSYARTYAYVEPWARTALATLALSEGRAADAIGELEPLMRHDAFDPSVVPWLHELTEAYVRTRRLEDARLLVERAVPRLEATRWPWLRATAAHCRALVADAKTYELHFEESLRWHMQTPMPLLQARTRLTYGERLRRTHVQRRRGPSSSSHSPRSSASVQCSGRAGRAPSSRLGARRGASVRRAWMR